MFKQLWLYSFNCFERVWNVFHSFNHWVNQLLSQLSPVHLFFQSILTCPPGPYWILDGSCGSEGKHIYCILLPFLFATGRIARILLQWSDFRWHFTANQRFFKFFSARSRELKIICGILMGTWHSPLLTFLQKITFRNTVIIHWVCAPRVQLVHELLHRPVLELGQVYQVCRPAETSSAII